MAYDGSSDDARKLREEAEHDSELAKERIEREKHAREEAHKNTLKHQLREEELALEGKKRELSGLEYEAPHLEHVIAEGRRHTGTDNTRTVERARDLVRDLKQELAQLTDTERDASHKVEEGTRHLVRTEGEASRELDTAQRELEHAQGELARLRTEHETSERESKRTADTSASERREEERTISKLRSELSTIQSQDREVTTDETQATRELAREKSEAAHPGKSRPDDGSSRELKNEERKDKLELATLDADIGTDEQEIRRLQERVAEKKKRRDRLQTILDDIERKLGAFLHAGPGHDLSAERKISEEEAAIRKLHSKHEEYTGRVREIDDEIREHETKLRGLGTETHADTSLLAKNKLRDAERTVAELETKVRDLSGGHTNHALSEEKVEVREATQTRDSAKREARSLETKLRDAEHALATAEAEAKHEEQETSSREEHARSATLRKREQDTKRTKLKSEIGKHESTIRDLKQQIG